MIKGRSRNFHPCLWCRAQKNQFSMGVTEPRPCSLCCDMVCDSSITPCACCPQVIQLPAHGARETLRVRVELLGGPHLEALHFQLDRQAGGAPGSVCRVAVARSCLVCFPCGTWSCSVRCLPSASSRPVLCESVSVAGLSPTFPLDVCAEPLPMLCYGGSWRCE